MSENEHDGNRGTRFWEYFDLDALFAFALGAATIVIGLRLLGHQVIEYWQHGERVLAAAISTAAIGLPTAGFMLSRSWRDFLRTTLILIFCLGGIVYLAASHGFKLPAGWLH